MTTWTEARIREHFAKLGVWRRAGVRAPHKPLLAMYALARVLNPDAPRLVPFTEAEPIVRGLIDQFGPPKALPRAHYPFWRLQRDGIWEIPEKATVLDAGLTTGGDARLSVLREVSGGFPAELHEALATRPRMVVGLIDALIDAHFPTSLRQEIRDALGMPGSAFEAQRLAEQVEKAYRYAAGSTQISLGRPRDPTFRPTQLRAWRGRCAMCGFEAKFRQQHLGVEAAHVMWHAAGGPDTPDNGLLLCVLHHRAFDRGAIGLEADRRIKISPELESSDHLEAYFGRMHGQKLPSPDGIQPPSPRFIAWHDEQVYRNDR